MCIVVKEGEREAGGEGDTEIGDRKDYRVCCFVSTENTTHTIKRKLAISVDLMDTADRKRARCVSH